jgi:bacterial/archaeal transporter family-2 protein
MLPRVENLAVAGTAAVFAGALIALQAPFNSELGDSTGTWVSATLNFAVGAVILIALTVALGGGFGRLGDSSELPWYYLIAGGTLGVAYVLIAIVTVRTLGASGLTAATLAGQLAASVALDRAGVLGLAEREITFGRIAGIALLAGGTYLVVR